MTRDFLENCIELKKEHNLKYIDVLRYGGDASNDEEVNGIWKKFYNNILNEVSVLNSCLLVSIIDYAIEKELSIENVINALKALDIEIE